MTTSRPPHAPGSRGESPELVELRRLRLEQPDLAPAVDLQVALLQIQHRVKARVPTSWIETSAEWLKREHDGGRPLFRFEDLPVEWTDVRLMVRQTADLLRRHDILEGGAAESIQDMARQGPPLERLITEWFNRKATRQAGATEPRPDGLDEETIDQVLTLAMRPFLERAAEAAVPRADLSTWTRPYCPFCGGDPELAVVTRTGERMLICGRCGTRWAFDADACPWCDERRRERITTFASPDGHYRISACESCRRYIKAFDARTGGRPVMPVVDTIATLPLDAAAMQRGYSG